MSEFGETQSSCQVLLELLVHMVLVGQQKRRRGRSAQSDFRVVLQQLVELGERLVEEYPNTRMAEEATELLAGLRNRAGLAPDRA